MRQLILDFPKQFRIGIESVKAVIINKKHLPITDIIICGMGGSALPGDLLKLFNLKLKLTELPIFIHRDYGLPKNIKDNSLIVCVSYSGDTEETISALEEAIKNNLKVLVIASGGKLIEIAREKELPFATVPAGVQPRCAIGYQFSALIKLLSVFGILKGVEKEILKLEENISSQELEAEGKRLAQNIKGCIPIVYVSTPYKSLARIWKIKFNENSKIPAFFNVFPELNHNEMIGVGEYKEEKTRRQFAAIILKDEEEMPLIDKRMKILSEIFREKGIKVIAIKMEGRDVFEKIFNNLILADWISYYLAIEQRIDPTPVALVEEFKKRMSSR